MHSRLCKTVAGSVKGELYKLVMANGLTYPYIQWRLVSGFDFRHNKR